MILKEKVLVKNFISLSVLQLSNYFFPLITLPYLVRVLGPEKFGLINFAAAFVGYFGILTDYGFNLSATREISINRNDKSKLTQIYNAVLIIKLVLFVTSIVIIIILIESIQMFRDEYLTYCLSFGTVFGNVLFPIWFFQGTERMKYIMWLNIIFKSIATILVFVVITNSSDYNLLVMLNSLSYILTGIFSLAIIRFKFSIIFCFPSIKELRYQLIEGWYIFISTVGISLYTISNTFILGLFTSNTIVGYFSAADKIRIAFNNIFQTVSQTVYPHLSELFNNSIESGLKFVRKLLINVGAISLLVSTAVFLFAKEIILLVLGKNFIPSTTVLQIITWSVFIIFLSNVTGVQTMLNLNYKKAFSRIILFASLTNLFLSFLLVPYFFEIGTSVSVLITEIIVTLGMFIFLYKRRINILKATYE